MGGNTEIEYVSGDKGVKVIGTNSKNNRDNTVTSKLAPKVMEQEKKPVAPSQSSQVMKYAIGKY